METQGIAHIIEADAAIQLRREQGNHVTLALKTSRKPKPLSITPPRQQHPLRRCVVDKISVALEFKLNCYEWPAFQFCSSYFAAYRLWKTLDSQGESAMLPAWRLRRSENAEWNVRISKYQIGL